MEVKQQMKDEKRALDHVVTKLASRGSRQKIPNMDIPGQYTTCNAPTKNSIAPRVRVRRGRNLSLRSHRNERLDLS